MIKKLSLIAVLVIIIGVIGIVVTYSLMNNKITIDEKRLIKNEHITSIEIDVDNTDVEFISIPSSDEARVELVGKGVDSILNEFSVKDEGETLAISLLPDNSKWFNFNLYVPTIKLKIYIPEKTYSNVNVNGSSSDVFWQSLKAESIGISTDSGDINVKKINSEDVNLRTVSGDVTIENLQGRIKTITDSGDVLITNNEILDSINAKTGSGDINIRSKKEPTDVEFEVNTSSGDVNLFNKYQNNAKTGKGAILIQLETNSGDISATKN
ncbi:DUF4097 family beta strand repeat-containing protein [Solibacillus sp. FSL R5-0449]|uniref:DUF4097 family beta strand repeat-containing protein n=1 Tax=Solibacillus sp. FSL R5-0449 TaxID=2921639 RepID=UPI0030CFAA0D